MVTRLLVGSSGGERAPAEKRGATTDRWFEPLHVQEPAAARERVAAQVAAGADIVVAPTWRSHRRALMAVGESRRSLEWTIAAVDVAREGVDAGLEQRAAAQVVTDESEPAPAPLDRDPPLVAGVVPILDEEPEPGSGRLLPREPAAARDYDEAAGHLADAAVDLILVETRADDRGAQVAVEAAARTGIPTWVAAIGAAAEGELATCAETAIDGGAAGLLFADGSADVAPRLAEGVAVGAWGGVVGEAGERSPDGLEAATGRWLEVGASVVGLLRGARPDRVAVIRATLDERIRAEMDAVRVRTARWDSVVADAAVMAPGGAGLWVSPALADVRSLPSGFAWSAAVPADIRRLPAAHFRLIVAAPEAEVTLPELAAALEPGGILVRTLEVGASAGDLRPVLIDDRAAPPLAILRRVL
jgi:hypothetical protein